MHLRVKNSVVTFHSIVHARSDWIQNITAVIGKKPRLTAIRTRQLRDCGEASSCFECLGQICKAMKRWLRGRSVEPAKPAKSRRHQAAELDSQECPPAYCDRWHPEFSSAPRWLVQFLKSWRMNQFVGSSSSAPCAWASVRIVLSGVGIQFHRAALIFLSWAATVNAWSERIFKSIDPFCGNFGKRHHGILVICGGGKTPSATLDIMASAARKTEVSRSEYARIGENGS